MCVEHEAGKRPFKLRNRALSHGNVRIQHAPKLAKRLLTNDGNDITPKRLDSVLRKRLETFVTLRTPVPISIYYGTVDVGRDGKVRFHPDVYDTHAEMKGQGRATDMARSLAP